MEWMAWPISWKSVWTSPKVSREGREEVRKSQISAMVGSCLSTPDAREVAMPSFTSSSGLEKSPLGDDRASSSSSFVISREQRRVKCAGFGDFPGREKRSQYKTATC